MINGHDLETLIELAFDYVSAETEQQANQVYDRAARLAVESNTSKQWLELVDHIREWNSNNEPNHPMSWASALKSLSTRQAELESSPTSTHEYNNDIEGLRE